MSQQSFNEVHIYVEGTEQKNTVRTLMGIPNLREGFSDHNNRKIYTINWEQFPQIFPNSPEMQHLKPMVNLKELQEIVLLISLGIPAEEAISTITKQGYES